MSLILYATRILFADRVLEDALAEEVRAMDLRRPLVVTDADTAPPGERAEACDRFADALPADCRPGWFEAADAAPATLARLLARLEAGRCDGVAGYGGAVALGLARRAGARAGDLPVVTVPTTTESVGLGPVAGEPGGAGLGPIPRLILCDPTLTAHSPPAATAAAGIDALTHCIEAFLGSGWNPPADGIALDGVRRAAAHLGRAVADGRDAEARRELLAAALDAGLAAQKGLGAVHALAHALEDETVQAGAARHRHGRFHAALLPPVLAFNAPATAGREALLAEAMGLPRGADLPAAVAALGARLGLPLTLEPLALSPAARDRIAVRAEADPASRTNPRHATAADYRRMLDAACGADRPARRILS